jgi:hypothetical protein
MMSEMRKLELLFMILIRSNKPTDDEVVDDEVEVDEDDEEVKLVR